MHTNIAVASIPFLTNLNQQIPSSVGVPAHKLKQKRKYPHTTAGGKKERFLYSFEDSYKSSREYGKILRSKRGFFLSLFSCRRRVCVCVCLGVCGMERRVLAAADPI